MDYRDRILAILAERKSVNETADALVEIVDQAIESAKEAERELNRYDYDYDDRYYDEPCSRPHAD